MEFSVQRQELLSAVNHVIGATEGRSTMQILAHLLLVVYMRGAIGVTATDLEVFATAECPAEVPKAGGEACIPARKIKDALAAIQAEQVECSLEGLKMTIEGEGTRFSFACLPAEEFPSAPEAGLEEQHPFQPGLLPKILNACAHAADQSGLGGVKGGIHLCREGDRLTAVATDGKRLSLVGLVWDGVYSLEQPVTLPMKAAKLLSPVVSTVEFSIVKNRLLRFESPGSALCSAVLEGDYPGFRHIIATDYPYLVTVGRKKLIEALTACGVVTDDKGRVVRLQSSAADQITVSALGDVGEVESLVPCSGDQDLDIRIPSKQLLQALAALDGEEVFLKYRDGKAPLLIFPADHGPWDERVELIAAMSAA